MAEISFTIDGCDCTAKKGQTIVEAAQDNGVYIPVLCYFDGLRPAGICRICTVKVGGRNMSACTTPVTDGMVILNDIDELNEMRRAIIEMLFVEGNHFCPACEKSGNCELQALAYRYAIMAPRFPFLFPMREPEVFDSIMIDHNRCVQCRRCVRAFKTPDGKNVFSVVNRSGKTRIDVNRDALNALSEEEAGKAMEICPVGSILRKEVGFNVPIGERKYDTIPIGSENEGQAAKGGN